MKSVLVILLTAFSFQALADQGLTGIDYSLTGSAQSYPLGGLLTAEVGYGTPLWMADPTGNEDDTFWKYGYVRPYVEINTAGVLNRGTVAIEIFPIAIFGVTAGVGASQRNSSYYQDFNCNDLLCNQTLNYQFVKASLGAGYGEFQFLVTGKYEKFNASEDLKPFYEEMSYLVGQAGEDDLRTLDILAGYDLSELWTVGVWAIYQDFAKSQNNNSSVFLLGSYEEGFWRASMGVGQYHSSHQDARPAVVMQITYTGIKGIGLF